MVFQHPCAADQGLSLECSEPFLQWIALLESGVCQCCVPYSSVFLVLASFSPNSAGGAGLRATGGALGEAQKLFAGSLFCSAIGLSRSVFVTLVLQAIWSLLRVEAGVCVLPLFPKICRLTIHVQWLCHELWSSHLLATHTNAQRDFCTGFGGAAANLAWFMEDSSVSSSWCFLTPQDADPATHKAWVLLCQPQRLHTGADLEIQLPEPGGTLLVSQ